MVLGWMFLPCLLLTDEPVGGLEGEHVCREQQGQAGQGRGGGEGAGRARAAGLALAEEEVLR